jgi:hypothetical protein
VNNLHELAAPLAAFDGGLQHVTGRLREALRAQEEDRP